MGSLFSTKNTEERVDASTTQASDRKTADTAVVFKHDGATIHNRACFGAGCYWGTEKYFKINFARQMYPESMIKNTFVGFMGPEGSKANPTYKEVCSGSTGHVEVYDFQYAGEDEMYEQLVRFFFQFHDPTTLNAQQNDVGTQYASVIYCYDKKQLDIANKVKAEVQEFLNQGKITTYKEGAVTTAVLPATTFYQAHEEHQEYLMKNPNGYCNHRIRIKEWPSNDIQTTAE
jgi:peptide-methionine (S)-S-oxide reductase